ncbi:39087_t:CDS:2, partial [Gigaspora margarita]
MEQSAAASQKTMTYFMLFLIIFLLEYIVYKRNGLPGLIVLNVLWLCDGESILGIYGYTLYQQKQEQAKIETFYQQETKKICGIVDEYSIFADGSELRTEQLENLKTVIQTKKEAQQKELEIQQQAETLQKATEIEKKLQQAQEGLGKVYPEFANKSVLLKELEKANRLLKSEAKETDQSFLNKLAKIPAPSEEECQLLSQLYLTAEQYIAISTQTQYLTRGEQELLPETYPNLNTQQKLQLINSGLNNLGINTYDKKEKFVQLNHALYHEKANFGLSQKEKESILRLLITTLDLTNEQRENLESMG